VTDNLDTTKIEEVAEKLMEAALDGDTEALKGLVKSGALDALGGEDGEPEVRAIQPKLNIHLKHGETKEHATAYAVSRPTVQAGFTTYTLLRSEKFLAENLNLNELIRTLGEQVEAVDKKDLARGEAMLTAQAHTLDTLFNYLSRKAMRSEYLSQFEGYLKLALRSQSQCRSTWEAISAIQNPPLAGYIRQANIAAGHQQVINALRTGEHEVSPDELLEKTEHESDTWVDRETPGTAEGVDSAVEAVGEIDGTAYGDGKE